jgi:uroporphyrinogen-III decarboxylase
VLGARLQANVDAVRYVAQHTDLVPVGMGIGPFSLMTKLVADPITLVYIAGMDIPDAEDARRTLETLMDVSVEVILRSFKAQAQAGAQAFFIAEPAANLVYISPIQMANDPDMFERLVLRYLRKIASAIREAGLDLIYHCCGELTDDMVKGFASLRPVLLSLGCSRKLWEDALIVPKDIVLYGNLPSKHFHSDEMVTVADVQRMSCELVERMKATGHPYILGTECDVLSVPGQEKTLMAKVMAIVNRPRAADRMAG